MLSTDLMDACRPTDGVRSSARRLDVDEVAVERLVTGRWNFRRHGEPRLDDALAALRRLLELQASVRVIAQLWGTSERQVQRWKADLAAGRDVAPALARVLARAAA